jgi:hypothetical protein
VTLQSLRQSASGGRYPRLGLLQCQLIVDAGMGLSTAFAEEISLYNRFGPTAGLGGDCLLYGGNGINSAQLV